MKVKNEHFKYKKDKFKQGFNKLKAVGFVETDNLGFIVKLSLNRIKLDYSINNNGDLLIKIDTQGALLDNEILQVLADITK